MPTTSGKIGIGLGLKEPFNRQEITKLNYFVTQTEMAINRGHINRKLFAATANVTVANTATETTLISATATGSLAFNPNFFTVGKTIILEACGFYSTAGVAPTIRFKGYLGSTVIFDTTAITTAASVSNLLWDAEAELICQTTGSGGTVIGQGIVHHMDDTSTRSVLAWPMVNTGTVTIDTTAAQTLDFKVTWGTANASNTITCTNLKVRLEE